MLRASTKTKLGARALRRVAKNPGLLQLAPPAAKAGGKLAKPFVKRRARRRVARVGEAAREIAVTVATYAPQVARAAEYLAPPSRKKRIARPAAGVVLGTGAVLGAAAVYFLEPRGGREHRMRVRKLVR